MLTLTKFLPTIVSTLTTGIVVLSASAVPLSGTIAAQSFQSPHPTVKQQSESGDRLPRRVANRVRRDLSQRLNIPRTDLSIQSASPQTWPDGCLGLGGPAELCLQGLVPGWQVNVTDGAQVWVYRTDQQGQTIRFAGMAETSYLPSSVRDRVLAAAAVEANVPVDRLQMVQAEPRTWNGCLGLEPENGICTMIAIPGWQVIVAGDWGSWVYHTDADGSEVRLNEAASQSNGTVQLAFISDAELPPDLESGVVFRMIESGGFSGLTREILLLEDGRIVELGNNQPDVPPTELHRLTRQQLEEFEQLLQQQGFSHLHRLSYQAPEGAADYRTVTLTGSGGTTRYADLIQDQLPSALQQVIQAWNAAIAGDR